ncbi:uncharacterized protein G2W53_043736 [Senna tora]|uniref:Uncharacterized protein n=1 Tax=Senna tora TaxID=362788 RepID=A0A834SHM6_9FABA|nr:uncharacterized protein G2W53_043736 [Senna tora]
MKQGIEESSEEDTSVEVEAEDGRAEGEKEVSMGAYRERRGFEASSERSTSIPE